MPSWVMTISDAEPPAAGIYKAMQKSNAGRVLTHPFAPRQRRPGGTGFFVYTGDHARDRLYPHVTVMLAGGTALFQKAGLLFFRSSTFHVSLSESAKLFYDVAGDMFQVERGQSSVLGLDTMKAMGTTFINLVRRDITGGLTPAALGQGKANLDPSDMHGLPPWQREALERQALEQDQARLARIVDRQNEAWARQFEWPDD